MVLEESGRQIQNDNGILSVPSQEKFPFEEGVGTVLFKRMSEVKTRVAQIDAVTGFKETYEDFLQKCVRTAITMRFKGITSKDVITVCSSNHTNTIVPLISSFFLGVKFANTDPNLSLADTVFLLQQVRPKMIFVSPEAVKLIEDTIQEMGISPEIVVFGESSEHSQFSDFLVPSAEENDFVPVEIGDMKETACIIFSSGSTGFPKGICLSHMSLLSQAMSALDSSDFHNLVYLSYSSAYWVSLINGIIGCIVAGATVLIDPSFNIDTLWNTIEKYKVSIAFLSPTQVATICRNGRPVGVDTSSLQICASAGGPLSLEQVETMRQLLPTSFFMVSYGQTELAGNSLDFQLNSPMDIKLAAEKPTTCGRPVPGYLYKVVDPETEETLDFNQPGELRIKTEYAMNGYHNVDSSAAWDSDGFLKTGDITYYDEDYCFFIVDRIKDMLKYQGWQIAPAKLEGVLLTHPAVEYAVVIGLPHPVDVDHPMGIVSLGGQYYGNVTPEELEKYVEERVSDKQRLRGGVRIVKDIPQTPTGKFRRKYLKDLVLAGKL